MNLNFSIPPEKRLIDIAYGDFIQAALKDLTEAIKMLVPESKPETIEPSIHPETGIPEGLDEEVGKIRACEILRSVNEPLGKATLVKYRKKPKFLPSGQNVGGYSLPYTIIGGKCSYRVKDLLAIRKDLYHFIK